MGSKDVCSYPKLNAAYHDLHRQLKPSYPPDSTSSNIFQKNIIILKLINLVKSNIVNTTKRKIPVSNIKTCLRKDKKNLSNNFYITNN